MLPRVECPACEHQFEPNLPSDKKNCVCPECGMAFDFSQLRSSPATSTAPASKPRVAAAAIPLPRRVQSNSALTPSRTNQPPQAPLPVAKPAPATPQKLVQTFQSDSVLSKVTRPSYNSLYLGLIFLCLAASISIAIVVTHNRNKVDEVSSASDLPIGQYEKNNQAEPEEQGSQSTVPLPTVIFPAPVRDQFVAALTPYVVQLQSKTPSGEINGTGLLLDSRGWILTPFDVANQAGYVEVTLSQSASSSSRPPEKQDQAESSADNGATSQSSSRSILAQGLLQHFPEWGVSLISVDPHDLSDTLDVSLSVDDYPGADVSVAAVGWKEAQVSWLSDFTVTEVLSAPSAEKQPSTDDSTSSKTRFTLSSSLETVYRGSPICLDNGVVVGVYVGENSAGRGMAVSVSVLRNIVNSHGGKLALYEEKPILGIAEAAPPNSPSKTDDNGASGAPLKNIAPGSLESIDKINELHQLCETMDWLPQTAAEYSTVQSLAEILNAADAIATNESIDEGNRILVSHAVSEVRDSLIENLPWPDDDDPLIKSVNEFAINSLQTPQAGFFAYGKVVLVPGIAPEVDGTGTVVLKLVGTEQLLMLPLKMNHDLFKLDTQWLVMGEDTLRGVLVSDATGNKLGRAAIVHAKYVIERRSPKL